jgi:hypothetical protein
MLLYTQSCMLLTRGLVCFSLFVLIEGAPLEAASHGVVVAALFSNLQVRLHSTTSALLLHRLARQVYLAIRALAL